MNRFKIFWVFYYNGFWLYKVLLISKQNMNLKTFVTIPGWNFMFAQHKRQFRLLNLEFDAEIFYRKLFRNQKYYQKLQNVSCSPLSWHIWKAYTKASSLAKQMTIENETRHKNFFCQIKKFLFCYCHAVQSKNYSLLWTIFELVSFKCFVFINTSCWLLTLFLRSPTIPTVLNSYLMKWNFNPNSMDNFFLTNFFGFIIFNEMSLVDVVGAPIVNREQTYTCRRTNFSCATSCWLLFIQCQ